MSTKGKIVPDYYVFCGKCVEHTPTCERRYFDACNSARKFGWKYTKQHGWVCHNCQ